MSDGGDKKSLEKKIIDLESRVKKLEDVFTLFSNLITKDVSPVNSNSQSQDPAYEDVVELVKKYSYVSASLLQRRLMIGYAKAARLIDLLEAKGVIGPNDGANGRKVFVNFKSKK